MKQVISLILICIMLFSIVNIVIAQNTINNDTSDNNTVVNGTEDNPQDDDEVEEEIEEEVDEETQEEVEDMETSHGAQMRLLQLERAMTRMVSYMGAVIKVLEGKGENVTEFNAMVEEMNILTAEVQQIPPNKADQEAVDAFVQIKSDARSLVKRFRDAARPLLSAEDKQALREEFKNIDKTKHQELTKRIRERKRMRNAEKVQKLLEKMEVVDEELINKIKEGTMTASEAAKELRDHYRALLAEKKLELRKKIRSEITGKKQVLKDRIAKAGVTKLEQAKQRLEQRADRLRQAGFISASERLIAKAGIFDANSQRIAQRRAAINNQIQTRS